MNDEWAETRLADFNLWIYSIDTSASNRAIGRRASFDSTLTNLEPMTREMIVNLLLLLANVVDKHAKA